MNTKIRKLPARLAKPTQFDAPVPFRGVEPNELERLSEKLLREALAGAAAPIEPALLRRAANEAAALAAVTAVPLLLFPELFAEKSDAARAYAGRQARVTERSRALLAEAA